MSHDWVDLDAETRRALEFDELLAWVATHAGTARGAQRILQSRPWADPASVAREHATVAEAREHLSAEGRLLPHRLPDPAEALQQLGVGGVRLAPKPLRELAAVTGAASELRVRLGALDAARFSLLRGVAARLPDLSRESRAVLDGVDSEGRILDQASLELARIRAARTRTGERLERLLRSMLQDPAAEPVIQDDFITQRNGRFVIPVRSDAPWQIKGIVHASSSSGATRFVEPLESVELNNELVRLAEDEREEQERILAEWSDAFRRRLDEVREALETVATIDALQARALFADETGAVRPLVGQGATVTFEGARHALLDRRLAERGERIVPLDLKLDPADRVLVISGPNTGGKTVALKTFGLSALMAQSGIPVPAARVELPAYRRVRADIGDHQSIQDDLSTFSAHVGALVGLLADTSGPALFLFDEIGTGTEPSEGAALARAILERLRQPGVTAVATTHLGAVKTWAFTAEGTASAAMEFDGASLRPTYRILMDVAGVSAGLDIAARLGLPGGIVARARELLDGSSQQGEAYLTRLRELTAELQDTRQRLRADEEALAERRLALESRTERDRERHGREAAEALQKVVREFREAARKQIQGVRDKRERAKLERELSRAGRALEIEAARGLAELAPGLQTADERASWPVPQEPRTGMEVYVHSLRREGTVAGVRGENVEVQFGSVTFSVVRSDLRAMPATRQRAESTPEVRRVSASVSTSGPSRRELHLIGKRVEEALEELDKFLDAAIVAGHDEVRIVHGHGTGRLRAAVRRFLDEHPTVRGHRPGVGAEGGDGATVAELV